MIDLGGDVTGNGISKLVFTILSAVAEAERDRIRERVSQVKADQRKRGRYLGGKVPFGFAATDNGGLVPVADEQDVIKLVLEMGKVRTEPCGRYSPPLRKRGGPFRWRRSTVLFTTQQADYADSQQTRVPTRCVRWYADGQSSGCWLSRQDG